MSRFLQSKFDLLEAYVPGEQPQDRSYVKLNTNESPFPPPEPVLAAMAEAAASAQLYCDPVCRALREAAADLYGLELDQILAFNGSDEALSFAFLAWGGDGVAFPAVSYGFYPVFAALHGLDALALPLNEDLSIDPAAYHGLGRLIVIANPNAPTGLCLSPAALGTIAAANPDHVLLVDEAYVAFGAESVLPLLGDHPNLVVVRTFSKSHSLAGARLGLAFGAPELMADLDLLRNSVNPYNVSRMGQAAGAAALRDDALFMARCRAVAKTRDDTASSLRALGFTVTDSKANFLFVRPAGCGGEALYRGLKRQGVLVRWFSRPDLKDWVRVSVGTEEQMAAFLAAVREVLTHADC